MIRTAQKSRLCSEHIHSKLGWYVVPVEGGRMFPVSIAKAPPSRVEKMRTLFLPGTKQSIEEL